MERVTKALLVIAIFLMAFLATAEGGRDIPTTEVYSPQTFLGFSGFPFSQPFPMGFFPGFGGIHTAEAGLEKAGGPQNFLGFDGIPFFHPSSRGNGFFPGGKGNNFIPWFGGIHKAKHGLKGKAKGEDRLGENPKVDGKASGGSP